MHMVHNTVDQMLWLDAEPCEAPAACPPAVHAVHPCWGRLVKTYLTHGQLEGIDARVQDLYCGDVGVKLLRDGIESIACKR